MDNSETETTPPGGFPTDVEKIEGSPKDIPLSEVDEEQRERQRQKSGISDDDDDDDNDHHHTIVPHHWLVCCLCERWPRLCSFFMGVVLPLWLLIFLSLFSGVLLSRAEASEEVQLNNDVMAARKNATVLLNTLTSFSKSIPVICLEAYLKEQQGDIEATVNLYDSFLWNQPVLSPPVFQEFSTTDDLILINTTDLHEFTLECAERAGPLLQRLVSLGANAESGATNDLTFNWIRCYPGIETMDKGVKAPEPPDYKPPPSEIEKLRPEAQQTYYSWVWRTNQEELYDMYLEENLLLNMTLSEAKVDAFKRSLVDATGVGGCSYNAPASAWFAFTVMTTIGYGNQAPVTRGGRSMLYTLGFVSLLIFGAILARAGQIVSFIFDDTMERCRWTHLTRPLVSCLLWGAMAYSWMVVIASTTVKWKEDRLGEPFPFDDGYWFAYISTTTIGLGDIFLEPEVIVTADLFLYPLVQLVGFTFFSAFLGKLTEVLRGKRKNRGFYEIMLLRMKENRADGLGHSSSGPRPQSETVLKEGEEAAHEK